MNQLQPEPIKLRTGAIASSRLRQYCQLSPSKAVPSLPPREARGRAGLLEDEFCPDEINGNQNALESGEVRREATPLGGGAGLAASHSVCASGMGAKSGAK